MQLLKREKVVDAVKNYFKKCIDQEREVDAVDVCAELVDIIQQMEQDAIWIS